MYPIKRPLWWDAAIISVAILGLGGIAYAQEAPADPIVQQLINDYTAEGTVRMHVQQDLQKLLETYGQLKTSSAADKVALACWIKDGKACEKINELKSESK